MITVKDPKQNQHCWCGILTLDSNEKQLALDAGNYVFLKTSRDAHFVAQGAIIERARILVDIVKAVEDIISSIPDSMQVDKDAVRDEINLDITNCQSEAKHVEVIEILEIDLAKTPLTNELNRKTEILFTDDAWLDRHSARVGAQAIRIGRRLPPLPKE